MEQLENRLVDISEIKLGDIWFACDGSGHSVTIESVDSLKQLVYYSWGEDDGTWKHSKSILAFQARYYRLDMSELETQDRQVCQHYHSPANCWECEEEQKQKLSIMSILGRKGVTSDMEFTCSDCGEKIHGGRILDGEYLYVVTRNTTEPAKSAFRCECCQEDIDDRDRN